jgi:hypothetical protein
MQKHSRISDPLRRHLWRRWPMHAKSRQWCYWFPSLQALLAEKQLVKTLKKSWKR